MDQFFQVQTNTQILSPRVFFNNARNVLKNNGEYININQQNDEKSKTNNLQSFYQSIPQYSSLVNLPNVEAAQIPKSNVNFLDSKRCRTDHQVQDDQSIQDKIQNYVQLDQPNQQIENKIPLNSFTQRERPKLNFLIRKQSFAEPTNETQTTFTNKSIETGYTSPKNFKNNLSRKIKNEDQFNYEYKKQDQYTNQNDQIQLNRMRSSDILDDFCIIKNQEENKKSNMSPDQQQFKRMKSIDTYETKSILKKYSHDPEQKNQVQPSLGQNKARNVKFRETTNFLNINNGQIGNEKLTDKYRIKKFSIKMKQIQNDDNGCDVDEIWNVN